MKHLSTLFIFFAIVLISKNAFAANINHGNVEVGGSISFSRSSDINGFTASPTAQYFFADHVSVGAEFNIATYSRATTIYSFGPVASFYFFTKDNMAPFVTVAPVNFLHYDNSGDLSTSSHITLGTKFFFTDSVAFGPEFSFYHYYPFHGYQASNSGALSGVFSIHL